MILQTVTINLSGKEESDIVLALNGAISKIQKGFTQGTWGNGNISFDIEMRRETLKGEK